MIALAFVDGSQLPSMTTERVLRTSGDFVILQFDFVTERTMFLGSRFASDAQCRLDAPTEEAR